jgi:hypothetical protein
MVSRPIESTCNSNDMAPSHSMFRDAFLLQGPRQPILLGFIFDQASSASRILGGFQSLKPFHLDIMV